MTRLRGVEIDRRSWALAAALLASQASARTLASGTAAGADVGAPAGFPSSDVADRRKLGMLEVSPLASASGK